MSELTMKNLEMLEYYVNEALWSLEQDLEEVEAKWKWQNADDEEEGDLEEQMEELREKIDSIAELLEIF